jgi:uncharacterized protein YdhG (YjbR/CyaY superfamily)
MRSFWHNEINQGLPEAESKIWHGHPVWFLDGNPTVGYSKQKRGIRLMFWSGADFEEPGLNVVGRQYKDASVFFNEAAEINKTDLAALAAGKPEKSNGTIRTSCEEKENWSGYNQAIRNKGLGDHAMMQIR